MEIARHQGSIMVILSRIVTTEKTSYRCRAYYKVDRSKRKEYSHKMIKDGELLAEISNQEFNSKSQKESANEKAKIFINSLFPEIKGTFDNGCMNYDKEEAEKLFLI